MRIVLGLQVAYLVSSLFVPWLPGWKMFTTIDRVHEFRLLDSSRTEFPIASVLPGTVFNLQPDVALKVASFACAKNPNLSPWTAVVEGSEYALAQPDCIPAQK